ncbi:MAG TPA: hypothetical protein VFB81_24525 [Myxococcales bacterium]|nr:hypothetical protein [Myxococcales bacterium]
MMPEDMDRLLRLAIAEKRMIRFVMGDGEARLGEPHDYGTLKGVDRVLVYQVGGASRSGGLPDWRLVTVGKISELEVTEFTFEGPRGMTRGGYRWERILASVSRKPDEG